MWEGSYIIKSCCHYSHFLRLAFFAVVFLHEVTSFLKRGCFAYIQLFFVNQLAFLLLEDVLSAAELFMRLILA